MHSSLRSFLVLIIVSLFCFSGTCKWNWFQLHGICKAEVWTILVKETWALGFFWTCSWWYQQCLHYYLVPNLLSVSFHIVQTGNIILKHNHGAHTLISNCKRIIFIIFREYYLCLNVASIHQIVIPYPFIILIFNLWTFLPQTKCCHP